MRELLADCFGDCGMGAAAPETEKVLKASDGTHYVVSSNDTTESGKTVRIIEPEVIAVSLPAKPNMWVIAAAVVGGAALLLGGKKSQRRRRAISRRYR